jgi:ATP-dependent helicase HepA
MTDQRLQYHAAMYRHLSAVAQQLAGFLTTILPRVQSDWWERLVLNVVTSQQRSLIERSGSRSLHDLDLAALLRILDENWYQLQQVQQLQHWGHDVRNYLKEMRTVRNRWAHASAGGELYDDIYRDLDTLQRFAAMIDADQEVLQALRSAKQELQQQAAAAHTVSSATAVRTPVPPADDMSGEFTPGTLVCLRSDPETFGVVRQVLRGGSEVRYSVLIGRQTQIFYASQLRPCAEPDADNLVDAAHFRAAMTALQLQHPTLSSLYSLNSARLTYIPYQYRPVLRFIRADRPRMLIADGVGVGKTIEAGLILRELQARSDIESVLIICPRALVVEKKWQRELQRFDEDFTALDGEQLRYCLNEASLDGRWPEKYRKAIVSYSLFDEYTLNGSSRSKKRAERTGLLQLSDEIRFDLIIVDEAHHIRNRNTYNHQAVRHLCDQAEAVVFLTATPIQLGDQDLFVLLNTLRPDLILDRESFEQMAAPNPAIHRAVDALRGQADGWQAAALAALDEAAATAWGQALLRHNPEFQAVRRQLAGPALSVEERVRLIRRTEELQTFAGLISRTRRRDIGAFTIRKPVTIHVPLTDAQRRLQDAVLAVQARIMSRISNDVSIVFLMTTIRRQLASSVFGLLPLLDDILTRHLDRLEPVAADDDRELPSDAEISSILGEIDQILAAAQQIDRFDPKLKALVDILHDKQQLPNNKVMVFSSFRHTLNYLAAELTSSRLRIGLVHGGTPDDERVALRARFEQPRESADAIDVMLFSEIGSEGLDYQFCDCIVNYDLPWNPMRIEQRIGRIDRTGQQSEQVLIYNLVTPDTIDGDIYDRCLVRIGVFSQALGGNEEILGRISREIGTISERYELTAEERREKLQQLADNAIRQLEEQQQLEQHQAELFGLQIPQQQVLREIDEATNDWLAAPALQHLIQQYLAERCGGREHFIGERAVRQLRLSGEARRTLLEDFRSLDGSKTRESGAWLNWLRGSETYLPVTFEPELAANQPKVRLINLFHPLTRQAANAYRLEQPLQVSLQISADEAAAGSYPFALYLWEYRGLKRESRLVAVCAAGELESRLLQLLSTAVDAVETGERLTDDGRDALEILHHQRRSAALAEHRARTAELGEFRRTSLAGSHRARVAQLEERMRSSNDRRIRQMQEAQLSNLEAEYNRRLEELQHAAGEPDITARQVVIGRVQLVEAGA